MVRVEYLLHFSHVVVQEVDETEGVHGCRVRVHVQHEVQRYRGISPHRPTGVPRPSDNANPPRNPLGPYRRPMLRDLGGCIFHAQHKVQSRPIDLLPAACQHVRQHVSRRCVQHAWGVSNQILHRNVKQLRKGLIFKALRRVYHSTPGSRVIMKKKKPHRPTMRLRVQGLECGAEVLGCRVYCLRFGVQGSEFEV